MSGFFDGLVTNQFASRVPSGQENATQKFAAIKRHLETLLNARQGCSQSSPELGLRDFNGHDVSSGDLLKQVSADIRRTIQRFEPRVMERLPLVDHARRAPSADWNMSSTLRGSSATPASTRTCPLATTAANA